MAATAAASPPAASFFLHRIGNPDSDFSVGCPKLNSWKVVPERKYLLILSTF